MGFKRYGVDHYIPGNATDVVASEEESIIRGGADTEGLERTTYSDNVQILIKQLESGDPGRKAKMLTQLKAVDSGLIYDDYFHPMAMDVVPPSTYENGNYDNNHIEMMVRDFIRFAQDGKAQGHVGEWSQAIPSRDYYAETLQPAIRDMLALVFGMDSETSSGFMSRAGTIVDRIPMISVGSGFDLAGFYTSVFQLGWHTLEPSKKQFYKTALWDKLKESGALEKLSTVDAGKLERHWPVLIDFVLTLAEADYNYKVVDNNNGQAWAGGSGKTMMLLGSFTTYSNFILQNHYPEVNLAWARAYDSYYDGETTEFEITCGDQATGYTVTAPTATAKGDGNSDDVLTEGTENSNALTGSQRIILENQGIVGEAIYYDLVEKGYNAANDKTIEKNRLYRGGIDLNNPGNDITKNYTIETYDISYGVRNTTKAVYNISLTGNSNNKVFSSIEQPADISGVPYGATDDQIKSRMPRTATIITEDGSRIPVGLDGAWGITEENPTDEKRDARELTVKQTVALPAGVVNSGENSLDVVVKVYVNEAPTAGLAKADLNSGTFLYDQKITLSTEEEGGTIWYAFGDDDDYAQYRGEEIPIERNNKNSVVERTRDDQGQEIETGRKILYLKVKTRKTGKWDSPDAIYEYIFESVISVPSSGELHYNGQDQTGVSSSTFYTVDSVEGGASISEDGAAVANTVEHIRQHLNWHKIWAINGSCQTTQ